MVRKIPIALAAAALVAAASTLSASAMHGGGFSGGPACYRAGLFVAFPWDSPRETGGLRQTSFNTTFPFGDWFSSC
jgi:hypothetical protein